MYYQYSKYFWVGIILILFSAWGGFIAGRLSIPAPASVQNIPKSYSLLTATNSSIKGKIIKINGKKITVLNVYNVSGEIELADTVSVSNPATQKGFTIQAAESKKLELGKQVNLGLEMMNKNYKVTSVTYLAAGPPLPSIPGKPLPTTTSRPTSFPKPN